MPKLTILPSGSAEKVELEGTATWKDDGTLTITGPNNEVIGEFASGSQWWVSEETAAAKEYDPPAPAWVKNATQDQLEDLERRAVIATERGTPVDLT